MPVMQEHLPANGVDVGSIDFVFRIELLIHIQFFQLARQRITAPAQ
jgi:hypothetical protein